VVCESADARDRRADGPWRAQASDRDAGSLARDAPRAGRNQRGPALFVCLTLIFQGVVVSFHGRSPFKGLANPILSESGQNRRSIPTRSGSIP
jgi:hypothetical protein